MKTETKNLLGLINWQLRQSSKKILFITGEKDFEATENTLFNAMLSVIPPIKTSAKVIKKRLAPELTHLKNCILVVLGHEMAKTFLGKETSSFENLRQKIHLHKGCPLIITYHPNDLLNQPENKKKAFEDLCFIAQVT